MISNKSNYKNVNMDTYKSKITYKIPEAVLVKSSSRIRQGTTSQNVRHGQDHQLSRPLKPPVAKPRLGLLEVIEQHELSAIQEVETPISDSLLGGDDDDFSVAMDGGMQEENGVSKLSLGSKEGSSSESSKSTGRLSRLSWREMLMMETRTFSEQGFPAGMDISDSDCHLPLRCEKPDSSLQFQALEPRPDYSISMSSSSQQSTMFGNLSEVELFSELKYSNLWHVPFLLYISRSPPIYLALYLSSLLSSFIITFQDSNTSTQRNVTGFNAEQLHINSPTGPEAEAPDVSNEITVGRIQGNITFGELHISDLHYSNLNSPPDSRELFQALEPRPDFDIATFSSSQQSQRHTGMHSCEDHSEVCLH
ncbi:UNVERIFIED_CONTAM: hypothetical protein FKN15_004576 [Acipenser sinensis]